MIIGGIVGAVAVIGILGALFGICLARRRRAANAQPGSTAYQMSSTAGAGVASGAMGPRDMRNSDSSAFMPLQGNPSMVWNASTTNLNSPYKDEFGGRPSEASSGVEFDPYNMGGSRVHTPTAGSPRWDGPQYEGPRYEGPRY